MENLESKLWEKLKEVNDPGANLNVVDMGLVKELSVSEDSMVDVTFRPPTPIYRLAFVIAPNIKNALEEVEGVGGVRVKVVDFVKAEELNRMMKEE